MNKKIIVGVAVLVLIVIGIFAFKGGKSGSEYGYKDATYIIDQDSVKLINGEATIEVAPGSASKKTIKYFGNEVKVDFNEDKQDDIVFLVTEETGGSGVFYYLVGAIKNAEGYWGMTGVFLGDRIAPQTTEYKNGEVIVNYAERKKDEPMTATPSVGVSRHFKFTEGSLVEIKK